MPVDRIIDEGPTNDISSFNNEQLINTPKDMISEEQGKAKKRHHT